MTSKDTTRHTSSQASEDGRSHSALPDGQMMFGFGRDRALANHFRAQERTSVKKTIDTSGRTSSGSSASADLTRSLANRLRTRLAKVGSMEYRQTWREKVTPSGRLYWAHTASAHRTSGSGCSGWPTPGATDNKGPSQPVGRRPVCDNDLPSTALLAGWATPANRDYRYPNKKSYRERSKSTKGEQLNNQVVHGLTPNSPNAETGKPAASQVLSQAFSLWLMGFLERWLQCSQGYYSWVLIQSLLSGSSVSQDQIDRAVYEVRETR